MSDFLGGDFGSSNNDEIDFDRAASAFPDISLDGSGDIPDFPSQDNSNNNVNMSNSFSFDDFESTPREEVKVTGDDEIDKFESDFPELDMGQQYTSPPPPQNYTATLAPRPQPSALSSTPIFTQTIDEDEPQVIKDWREKQQAEIKARDEASKARRQETISKAEASIDEFYEDYAKKKERNIRENKDQESEYLAKLNESLSIGTTWERICELIELQNSQSKTIARTGAGTTDLTRFKEVLLRLKREGDSAPGAAGY
ncbi:clathrin light chain-domain-containing protein [Crucibulum laeve]|uniref:Clathrin light chain n=1 Tax=Crucibulum laeve TaxID=68775 RepID=A0A5C3MJ84_9AGAR|nr:clathrin light chain-domain-containing protein [Crucibulum laeve]